MALFHEARRRDRRALSRDEDWLGIAVAERLEFVQPAGENRRDVVERKLGVDVEHALGLAGGKAFLGSSRSEAAS